MSTVAPDHSHALTPTGNLRRRMLVSRTFEAVAVTAAALAVAVLAILVGFTVVHGAKELSWGFMTADLPNQTGGNGGVGPAIVGTLELAAIGGALATVVGVLTALLLTEFATPRIAAPVRLVLDLLAGLPPILTGVVIYGLIVAHFSQSTLAGAIGLAIVMVPLVARGSFEALGRIPDGWRDAADALGVSHWRTVVGIVLPGASSGIVTASILAIALGAGEAAPLLFADPAVGVITQANPLHAAPSLPMEIYTLFEAGYPTSIEIAWGGAFLLMLTILFVNIGARIWLRRGERRRGLL